MCPIESHGSFAIALSIMITICREKQTHRCHRLFYHRSKLRGMLVPSGIVLWRVQRVAKNEAGVVQQSFEVLHLKGISQHLSRFPLHGKDRIIKIRTGMATFRSVSFHSYSSKPIVRESAVIILEKLGSYSPYLGETD